VCCFSWSWQKPETFLSGSELEALLKFRAAPQFASRKYVLFFFSSSRETLHIHKNSFSVRAETDGCRIIECTMYDIMYLENLGRREMNKRHQKGSLLRFRWSRQQVRPHEIIKSETKATAAAE